MEKLFNRARATDRVTVYRILEWLTANELAHKIAGGDRVWRFCAARHEHAQHVHFECNRCGTVVCLDELGPQPRIKLPSGFRTQYVELLVKGLCAECVPPHQGGQAPRFEDR